MSLSNETIALTFLSCFGQFVLIFSELTFCMAHDKLDNNEVHSVNIEVAAGLAAIAALGDRNVLLHVDYLVL